MTWLTHRIQQLNDIHVKPRGFPTLVLEALPSAVERIVQEYHPVKIVLFGSYGYGKPTPDSDVDLLVVRQTSEQPLERYLAISRLLRPRPFPVDIIVKTPNEIAHALGTGDFFIKEILTRGKILYERDH